MAKKFVNLEAGDQIQQTNKQIKFCVFDRNFVLARFLDRDRVYFS